MKNTHLLVLYSLFFCVACSKKNIPSAVLIPSDVLWKNAIIEVETVKNRQTAVHDLAPAVTLNDTKIHPTLAVLAMPNVSRPYAKKVINSRQNDVTLKENEYPRKANPFEVVVIFLGLMIIVGLLILAIIAFGFLALFILAGLLGIALFRSIFPKKMKTKGKEV